MRRRRLSPQPDPFPADLYGPPHCQSSRRLTEACPGVDGQTGGGGFQPTRPGGDPGAKLARSAKHARRSSKLLLQRLSRRRGPCDDGVCPLNRIRFQPIYTALLIVNHPDGSLRHVPEWMARPEAAVFSPRDRVVIPVRNLRDLRSTLDVLLSSFSSDSVDGGGHAKTASVPSTGSVSSG